MKAKRIWVALLSALASPDAKPDRASMVPRLRSEI
jgi:hypothetical protein